MPRGGKLRIESMNVSVGTVDGEAERGVAAGDYVRIVVSDIGHGMPPDVADRVFEPFFTTKEIGQGLGLGLSVSAMIVQNHGGEIRVESTAGKGTLFQIQLPLEKSTEPA
jgi:two-component system cell cycle sensor histidine kinase/response regulator CckA